MFKQTYQHRCYSDNCAYTMNANNFSSINLRSEFKCNAKGSTGRLTMTLTWYIRYWHQIAPYVSDTADFDLKKAIFLMLQQQEQAKHAICFFFLSLFFTLLYLHFVCLLQGLKGHPFWISPLSFLLSLVLLCQAGIFEETSKQEVYSHKSLKQAGLGLG